MIDKIRITTDNIRDELDRVSSEYGIDPINIDFEIINKQISTTANVIKATYEIEVMEKAPDILFDIINLEIDNTTNTKDAFIKVDCTQLKKTLEPSVEYILKIIYKKLAMNTVIYGIKETNFLLIAKEIQKRLSPGFKKFKVLVASGLAPINGKDSELKTFFQLNTVGSIDDRGNINFKEKNFAVGVENGSVIAEYIKPTKGTSGYDIFGNILGSQDGRETQHLSNVKVDSADIDRIEDDISVKFVSKKKGSLILNNNVFHIEENIKVERADIKTGNINLEGVSDLSIGSPNDLEEDTVGAGIKVTGKKIVVNGNVGPKAYIEADYVDIKGSVHQDAIIKAKTAHIKILNGTLLANEAFIESANYANIETKEKLIIDNCFSCNILSPYVEIKKEMLSSNLITSSKEVILNNVLGNSNKISIKPLLIKQIAAEYKENLVKQKMLSNELKELQSRLDVLKQKLDSNLKNFSEAVKIIKDLQSKGASVPSSLLNTIKNFKETDNAYKEEKNKLLEAETEYKVVFHNIKELQNSYKMAHIIVKGSIEAENLIEFDDTLSRRLATKQNNIKIYVREVDGKEKIVIEPLS